MSTISIITLCLCLFQAVFASIGTLIRTKLRNRYDLVDWFVIGVAAYNGLVCPLIIFELKNGINRNSMLINLFSKSEIWLYPLYSLIVVLAVWGGAGLVKKLKNERLYIEEIEPINKSKSEKRCYQLAFVFLLAGVLTYWVYVYPYGGFIKYLDVSQAIRSGSFDEVKVDHGFTFLKRFGGFCFFSSLIFAGLIIRKRIYEVPVHLWLIFMVSVAFSIYVLFSWGGRLGILFYVVNFPLGYYFYKKGMGYKSFTRIIVVLSIVLILFPSIDQLWGKHREKKPLAQFFVKELSFPLFVFSKANEVNKPRWMKDVIFSPAYFLPTKVWSGILNIDTVSAVSTKRILGVRKGERGSTIGIPVDFVSFGLMEGGIVGIAILSVIIGVFLSKINNWVFLYMRKGIREMLYGHLVLSVSIQTVIYSDPQHIIMRNFHFIIGFVILCVIGRRRLLNTHIQT